MIQSMYNKFSLTLTQQKEFSIPRDDFDTLSPLYHYIVDLSKESPVYLLNTTNEIQDLALAIKTSALNVNESLQNFVCQEGDLPICIQNHKLVANIPDVVEFSLLPGITTCPNYSIKIDKVATGQMNRSLECYKNQCDLPSGIYSFYVETVNQRNEFEVTIHDNCTNLNVFKRISKLLNNSCVNLSARIIENGDKVTLEVETGPNRRDVPATIILEDITSPNGKTGLISYYQLDNKVKGPTETIFQVNRDYIHSYGTGFILDDVIEINLLASSEEVIYITKDVDYEFIFQLVDIFIDNMNSLINCGNTKHGRKLFHKIDNVLNSYEEQLQYLGLNYDENYNLSAEYDTIENFFKDASILPILQSNDSVVSKLLTCIREIVVDPMEYIQKKVVAYNNNNETHYPNPYITSSYTGFLFSSYC